MATIKVKQIKSKIGYPVDQKRTLQALGLRKISQETRSVRSRLSACVRSLRLLR